MRVPGSQEIPALRWPGCGGRPALKKNLEILLEAGLPGGGPARAREGVGGRGSFRATWPHLGSAEAAPEVGREEVAPRILHLERLAADAVGLGRRLVEVGAGVDRAEKHAEAGGRTHPSSHCFHTTDALLFSVQSELPGPVSKKFLDGAELPMSLLVTMSCCRVLPLSPEVHSRADCW